MAPGAGGNHREFVVKQLQAGRAPHAIVSMLKVKGLDATAANQLIASVQASGEGTRPMPAARAPSAESPTFGGGSLDDTPAAVLPKAAIAGALGAAVCGVIWGIVTYVTNTEFGYLALGVGAVCGIAVRSVSEGHAGLLVRLIAAGFSVIGILIGKYVGLYFFLTRNAELLAQHPEIAQMKMLGLEYALVFVRLLPKTLEAADVLFFFLAIYMAFKMSGTEQAA